MEHQGSRNERLRGRSKRCVCKYCGGELKIKSIILIIEAPIIIFGYSKYLYTLHFKRHPLGAFALAEGVGFEPTNDGFANRCLRPLGYPALLACCGGSLHEQRAGVKIKLHFS